MKKASTKKTPKPKTKTKALPKKELYSVKEEHPPIEEIARTCGRNAVANIKVYEEKSWPSLTLYPMVTGCGFGTIYGNTNLGTLSKEVLTKLKKKLLDAMKTANYGAVVATLGDAHVKTISTIYMDNLLALGFVKLSDYNNPAHGTVYRQHLYILKAEDNK